MSQPWSKVTFGRATEVSARYKASDQARALLLSELAPKEYVATLVGGGLGADALMFLAHALPKREAAWWACLCAREADAVEGQRPEILAALEAAEQWVRKPSEETRRAAGSAAEKAGTDHASSWAAMAAFMSGGSMAPPNVEPVPPPEGQTSIAAFATAILAATARDADKPLERFAAMLALGEEVATGASTW